MSDINKRGLPDVHFNLVTAVKSFTQNATPNGVPSQDFLAEWIKDHPTFKAIEAVNAFRADGRSNTACYPALAVLVGKGILKKLAPGEYSRTDIKALPAPNRRKAQAKHAKVRKDVSASDFALRTMRRTHGRMSSLTLKKHFENDGRAASGVGPILNRLTEDKKIKRVGEGIYEVITPKRKSPKATANGASPVEIEIPVEA
jgi:hypothetical protein